MKGLTLKKEQMSKKNLPNIPIYIGDWERDCNVLTLESEAAWMRIIFKMWTGGKQSSYKIPAKGLQNLWRCSAEKAQEIIDEFTDYNICEVNIDGRFIEFTSRRFLKENSLSEVRSEAASSRYNAKSKQSKSKIPAKDLQTPESESENENENENENESALKNKKSEFEKIVDSFNLICDKLPKVQKLTKARKSVIKNRADEYDFIKISEVFQKTASSSFLCGNNDKGWTADFDWVLNPNNFIKILEGRYDNKYTKDKNGTKVTFETNR